MVLSNSDRVKGGKSGKSQTIQRQAHVERLMQNGYTLTRIAATQVNGKNLGSKDTISKDIKIIETRWLENDQGWFNRARTARIVNVKRLTEQLVRLSDLYNDVKNGVYDTAEKIIVMKDKNSTDVMIEKYSVKDQRPGKLVRIESDITKVITTLYEIDADFDPEQYLDSRITEAMENKIKKTETAISR